MSQSQIHCVVILGELSVGKSALCRKFFHTGIPGHGTCDYDDVFSCHGVTGKNSDGQGKNRKFLQIHYISTGAGKDFVSDLLHICSLKCWE